MGLTGGLASGKSTALGMFAQSGARVLSADAVVHDLYERPSVKSALRGLFGDRAFDRSGRIDRRALAHLIAGDEDALRALETLVHPLVGNEMSAFIAEGGPGSVTVCEVPLLVEGGLPGMFDLVVTIEVPVEVRRERAASRMTPEIFDLLDSRLAGEKARSAAADATYVNTGSLEDLAAFVARIYKRAQALAEDEVRESQEHVW
ncbi:MAG: dephospho-CoA kinase [Thermoleophilia bacterium]